jgi:hypothetical protein
MKDKPMGDEKEKEKESQEQNQDPTDELSKEDLEKVAGGVSHKEPAA